MNISDKPLKNIIVLVSGGGTNLQALIDAQNNGQIIGGKISCVISSNPMHTHGKSKRKRYSYQNNSKKII